MTDKIDNNNNNSENLNENLHDGENVDNSNNNDFGKMINKFDVLKKRCGELNDVKNYIKMLHEAVKDELLLDIGQFAVKLRKKINDLSIEIKNKLKEPYKYINEKQAELDFKINEATKIFEAKILDPNLDIESANEWCLQADKVLNEIESEMKASFEKNLYPYFKYTLPFEKLNEFVDLIQISVSDDVNYDDLTIIDFEDIYGKQNDYDINKVFDCRITSTLSDYGIFWVQLFDKNKPNHLPAVINEIDKCIRKLRIINSDFLTFAESGKLPYFGLRVYCYVHEHHKWLRAQVELYDSERKICNIRFLDTGKLELNVSLDNLLPKIDFNLNEIKFQAIQCIINDNTLGHGHNDNFNDATQTIDESNTFNQKFTSEAKYLFNDKFYKPSQYSNATYKCVLKARTESMYGSVNHNLWYVELYDTNDCLVPRSSLNESPKTINQLILEKNEHHLKSTQNAFSSQDIRLNDPDIVKNKNFGAYTAIVSSINKQQDIVEENFDQLHNEASLSETNDKSHPNDTSNDQSDNILVISSASIDLNNNINATIVAKKSPLKLPINKSNSCENISSYHRNSIDYRLNEQKKSKDESRSHPNLAISLGEFAHHELSKELENNKENTERKFRSLTPHPRINESFPSPSIKSNKLNSQKSRSVDNLLENLLENETSFKKNTEIDRNKGKMSINATTEDTASPKDENLLVQNVEEVKQTEVFTNVGASGDGANAVSPVELPITAPCTEENLITFSEVPEVHVDQLVSPLEATNEVPVGHVEQSTSPPKADNEVPEVHVDNLISPLDTANAVANRIDIDTQDNFQHQILETANNIHPNPHSSNPNVIPSSNINVSNAIANFNCNFNEPPKTGYHQNQNQNQSPYRSNQPSQIPKKINSSMNKNFKQGNNYNNSNTCKTDYNANRYNNRRDDNDDHDSNNDYYNRKYGFNNQNSSNSNRSYQNQQGGGGGSSGRNYHSNKRGGGAGGNRYDLTNEHLLKTIVPTGYNPHQQSYIVRCDSTTDENFDACKQNSLDEVFINENNVNTSQTLSNNSTKINDNTQIYKGVQLTIDTKTPPCFDDHEDHEFNEIYRTNKKIVEKEILGDILQELKNNYRYLTKTEVNNEDDGFIDDMNNHQNISKHRMINDEQISVSTANQRPNQHEDTLLDMSDNMHYEPTYDCGAENNRHAATFKALSNNKNNFIIKNNVSTTSFDASNDSIDDIDVGGITPTCKSDKVSKLKNTFKSPNEGSNEDGSNRKSENNDDDDNDDEDDDDESYASCTEEFLKPKNDSKVSPRNNNENNKINSRSASPKVQLKQRVVATPSPPQQTPPPPPPLPTISKKPATTKKSTKHFSTCVFVDSYVEDRSFNQNSDSSNTTPVEAPVQTTPSKNVISNAKELKSTEAKAPLKHDNKRLMTELQQITQKFHIHGAEHDLDCDSVNEVKESISSIHQSNSLTEFELNERQAMTDINMAADRRIALINDDLFTYNAGEIYMSTPISSTPALNGLFDQNFTDAFNINAIDNHRYYMPQNLTNNNCLSTITECSNETFETCSNQSNHRNFNHQHKQNDFDDENNTTVNNSKHHQHERKAHLMDEDDNHNCNTADNKEISNTSSNFANLCSHGNKILKKKENISYELIQKFYNHQSDLAALNLKTKCISPSKINVRLINDAISSLENDKEPSENSSSGKQTVIKGCMCDIATNTALSKPPVSPIDVTKYDTFSAIKKSNYDNMRIMKQNSESFDDNVFDDEDSPYRKRFIEDLKLKNFNKLKANAYKIAYNHNQLNNTFPSSNIKTATTLPVSDGYDRIINQAMSTQSLDKYDRTANNSSGTTLGISSYTYTSDSLFNSNNLVTPLCSDTVSPPMTPYSEAKMMSKSISAPENEHIDTISSLFPPPPSLNIIKSFTTGHIHANFDDTDDRDVSISPPLPSPPPPPPPKRLNNTMAAASKSDNLEASLQQSSAFENLLSTLSSPPLPPAPQTIISSYTQTSLPNPPPPPTPPRNPHMTAIMRHLITSHNSSMHSPLSSNKELKSQNEYFKINSPKSQSNEDSSFPPPPSLSPHHSHSSSSASSSSNHDSKHKSEKKLAKTHPLSSQESLKFMQQNEMRQIQAANGIQKININLNSSGGTLPSNEKTSNSDKSKSGCGDEGQSLGKFSLYGLDTNDNDDTQSNEKQIRSQNDATFNENDKKINNICIETEEHYEIEEKRRQREDYNEIEDHTYSFLSAPAPPEQFQTSLNVNQNMQTTVSSSSTTGNTCRSNTILKSFQGNIVNSSNTNYTTTSNSNATTIIPNYHLEGTIYETKKFEIQQERRMNDYVRLPLDSTNTAAASPLTSINNNTTKPINHKSTATTTTTQMRLNQSCPALANYNNTIDLNADILREHSFKLDQLSNINPKRLNIDTKFFCRVHDHIDENGSFWLEVMYSKEDEMKFQGVFKLFRMISKLSKPPAYIYQGKCLSALYKSKWHRAIVTDQNEIIDYNRTRRNRHSFYSNFNKKTISSIADDDDDDDDDDEKDFNLVTVRFVDLGVTKMLDRELELREVDDRFFNSPLKALHCTIRLNSDVKFTREMRRLFRRLTYEKILIAQIVGYDSESKMYKIILGCKFPKGFINIYWFILSLHNREEYERCKQISNFEKKQKKLNRELNYIDGLNNSLATDTASTQSCDAVGDTSGNKLNPQNFVNQHDTCRLDTLNEEAFDSFASANDRTTNDNSEDMNDFDDIQYSSLNNNEIDTHMESHNCDYNDFDNFSEQYIHDDVEYDFCNYEDYRDDPYRCRARDNDLGLDYTPVKDYQERSDSKDSVDIGIFERRYQNLNIKPVDIDTHNVNENLTLNQQKYIRNNVNINNNDNYPSLQSSDTDTSVHIKCCAKFKWPSSSGLCKSSKIKAKQAMDFIKSQEKRRRN